MKTIPRSSLRVRRVACLLALAACWIAAPALAQYGESKGNLYGYVADEQGGVLPGVAVNLSGEAGQQDTVTDTRGAFRFLNLVPGTYTVTLTMPGFATVKHENVEVSVGKNTEVRIPLKLSSVAETLTVRDVAPLIDTRKVQAGAVITPEEMKEIPTARDPWVILQSTGGVEIDRINVAGSESGQQSNYMSKGSIAGTYTMDGVNVTDFSTVGGSNIYYDFDSFQEMQVITGGSDASIQGPGPHINMVTKHGTNDVHGSARLFDVDKAFESDNTPGELKAEEAAGGGPGAGNHISSVQDYGAELGGPLWADRMWLWGAYGRNQINLVAVGGATDKTTLENFNAKYSWQILPSNSFNVWYQRSNKLKFGRNASATNPQETTEDQTLPQNTWKFEDSHVFSANIFSSVMFSGQNGYFTLTPEGGTAAQRFLDANGVNHNSYYFFQQSEPIRQFKADTSVFFNTGSLGHELKFGFQYLKATVHSGTSWPGDGSGGLAAQTYGDLYDCGEPCAVITRASSKNIDVKYYSAFLTDTITADRLTINAGLRWDRQFGDNLPSSISANPTFPDILPAVNYAGSGRDFVWNDYSPRLGITYALGQDRNTVLRASYARFVDNLNTGLVGTTNPLAGVAYAYYGWNDLNGDNLVQPNEIGQYITASGYDPANPASVGSSPNGIAHNLKSPKTDEFIIGLDREVVPGLALGADYTYRKYKDVLYAAPYYASTGQILTSSDYVLYDNGGCATPPCPLAGTIPGGPAYSIPIYQIDPNIIAANDGSAPGGTFTYNRPNFSETYSGVELELTKRLANKWMARMNFTYQLNKQQVGSGACADPNLVVTPSGLVQSNVGGQSCRDGDLVAVQSAGSGKKDSIFLNSKWQFNINGMYQLPAGFNVAGNLFGRQGYPIVWFAQPTTDDGVTRKIQLQTVDSARYKNVYELDLRLEKVIQATAGLNITVSADLFNALNSNTVFQRYNQTDIGAAGQIKEVQSPRIWRFGVRMAF